MKTIKSLKQTNIWTKRLLTLLTLCFFAIASTIAQSESCKTIGNGYNENLDFPFAGAVSHSYLQQIFFLSDLQAEEIEEGDNITALAFNYFFETPTIRPIKIYLGTTTAISLDDGWITTNDLTLVFSSNCQEFSKGEDNWTKIALDTDFTYTGDNIILAVLMNKEDATDTENCFTHLNSDKRFYTHNASLAISRFVKDGLDIPITFDEAGMPKTNENLVGNSLQSRSNIKFCKIDASCPKVAEVMATNIEENSITLDWTNGSNETAWSVEYGSSGFTLGEGTALEVTAHPLIITDLSESSSYDFFVRANCSDDDNSDWEGPKTISTSCGNLSSFPYLEDFENYGEGNSEAFPICWFRPVTYDGPSTKFPSIVNAVSGMTGKCLKFKSLANVPTFAVTPKIATNIEDVVLEFLLKKEGGASGSITIGIMTTPNDPDTFSEIKIIEPENNEPIQYSIKFSDFSITGSNKCIAFKHSTDAENYLYWLDDVKIREKQSGNDILSFNSPDMIIPGTINNEGHMVSGMISMNSDLTQVTPTITISDGASISPESGSLQNFTNPVNYTVTSETGEEQIWQANLIKSATLSTENNIISFTFHEQIGESIINVENATVFAIAKWNTNLTSITPTIEISNFASISPESGTAQDFSDGVIYTITAEDINEIKNWKVSIITEESICLNSMQTPFLETFLELSSSIDCWTIIDNNNDGLTSGSGKWTIHPNLGEARYRYNEIKDADDWLVSPKISIPENAKIKFDYKIGSSTFDEKFSVYIIQSSPLDIENTINILPTITAEDLSWQTLEPISLSEYANQDIYIAIKCESDMNKYILHIKDFSIYSSEGIQFKITSSAEDNGNIEPLGETLVNAGESKAYTIIPDENYEILKVLVDDIDKTSEITAENTYTFTEVNADHTIVAKFKALEDNTFTISASVEGENGSIDPTGDVSVLANASQVFTITPDENYQIDKVLVDNVDKTSEITAENTYTFTEVNADHTIVAKFKALGDNTFTISASVVGENGSIDPTGDVSVLANASQVFTITPDENYQIDKVLVDNVDKTSEITAENTYTFTEVSADHTIVAKFKALEDNTFTISASVVGENGSIDPTGDVSVLANASQVFTITPDENYQINMLLVDGLDKTNQITDENTYSFSEVNADHTIVARFKALDDNTHTILASVEDGNGSIDPSGDVSVEENANQIFTITPDENYQIDKVLVDNADKTSEITAENTYTFTEVNANHTIVAKFKTLEDNTFTISASVVGGNGNIDPTGDVIVLANASQVFTITPDENYQIDKVLVDNVDKTGEISAENTYTFTEVNADHTIVAKFKNLEDNTFTISASVVGGNGSIDPTGDVSVEANASQIFTITPDENYQIDKVLVDNVDKTSEISAENTYTFTEVNADHTIVAKFKALEDNSYTITCMVFGTNGSIIPENTTVNAGDELEVTIIPDNGYKLNKLLDNVIDKTDEVVDNKYKLTNIQEDHNIVAKFEVNNSITDETLIEILIYPNPTNNELNIQASEKITHIEILTTDAKLIHKQNVNAYKFQFSSKAIAEGNYIVRIFTIDNKLSIRQFSIRK